MTLLSLKSAQIAFWCALVALGTFAADPAHADETLASGTFEGRNGHVVTGEIRLVRTDNGVVQVILGKNFSLDNAPDPKLGFARGGNYVTESQFTALKSKTGLQVYTLPEGVDTTGYDGFYVWCEQFSVALGYAALE